jgi:hypothetical protein
LGNAIGLLCNFVGLFLTFVTDRGFEIIPKGGFTMFVEIPTVGKGLTRSRGSGGMIGFFDKGTDFGETGSSDRIGRTGRA